jgi:hypothetical protein
MGVIACVWHCCRNLSELEVLSEILGYWHSSFKDRQPKHEKLGKLLVKFWTQTSSPKTKPITNYMHL